MTWERMTVIVGALLAVVMIGGGILVSDLANTLHESNKRLQIGRYERTRLSYFDLVLDCRLTSAIGSQDPVVRNLCDNELPQLKELMDELEEHPDLLER